MAQIIEDGYGGNNDPENLTMLDIARIQAHNYADENEDLVVMLRQDEGMSIHAILKNAYQMGFMGGFTYKLTGDKDGYTLQGREDN